ncbi:PEP-CTERM sorting domain-containing protein [Paludibaculum fermentans]|uniref:PEP-CTERM sorting domain-containing protein n=1 Tax=Paludibaculum fermentans TaxID=1473598 RepID=UPI003EBDF19D
MRYSNLLKVITLAVLVSPSLWPSVIHTYEGHYFPDFNEPSGQSASIRVTANFTFDDPLPMMPLTDVSSLVTFWEITDGDHHFDGITIPGSSVLLVYLSLAVDSHNRISDWAFFAGPWGNPDVYIYSTKGHDARGVIVQNYDPLLGYSINRVGIWDGVNTPEPSSGVLLSLGIGLCLAARKFRRARS